MLLIVENKYNTAQRGPLSCDSGTGFLGVHAKNGSEFILDTQSNKRLDWLTFLLIN